MRNYRNWIVPQSSESVSVWSSRYEHAVVSDSRTGRLHLTTAFENHVHNATNWKLGQGIRLVFPEAEQFGIELE